MRKNLILCVFAFLFIVSCTPKEEIYVTEYGKKIGPSGGKYQGIDNVTIIVPEGAVSEDINFTIYSIDTPPFTAQALTLTNIYTLSPSAYKFMQPLTVVIPYDETTIPRELNESMIRAYYAVDRDSFVMIEGEDFELDMENNGVRIKNQFFLGNFYLGFPKEFIPSDDDDVTGIAEMVYIPAGEFEYGAPAGTPTGVEDGQPGVKESQGTNKVSMSAYYIDKYEVTNSQYWQCVGAGVCTDPSNKSTLRFPDYYVNLAYQNYPVLWVTWNQAQTFCQWANKRLPTEAEWEKASRGSSIKKYPWGDTDPEENAQNAVANFATIFEDVMDVFHFADGKSPYSAFNMAGNVAEWTNTWYDIDSYYTLSSIQQKNPKGPEKGKEKVIRGGSWLSLKDEITTYARDHAVPLYRYYDIGFRCVKEVEE